MNAVKPRISGSSHDAIRRLVAGCGGVEAVADFLGKGASTVYAWTNPDSPGEAPFALIATLTDHFGATACAEHLALRAGGVFLPLPPADSGAAEVLSAEVADEVGGLLADMIRSSAKGSEGGEAWTPREAARILADADRLLHTVAEIRSLAARVVTPPSADAVVPFTGARRPAQGGEGG
ncbi:hypothetical protein [Methylobrevis pamukkalensis]|uniref:Phage regulatory protein CII (CP76) n=1 Tax=Methylobrevis pamukkalensis TaxID=1439726 RepID=A0A1E3H1M8_9HYPH|nr:hypothetical protein [Methylobrevis pamukkalensis]ODN70194.1 hypothetical protein A6302_02468 [Methylobrevis pamukkalensis]